MEIGTKLRYAGSTYLVISTHGEYIWVKHQYCSEYKTIHENEVLFADSVEKPEDI